MGQWQRQERIFSLFKLFSPFSLTFCQLPPSIIARRAVMQWMCVWSIICVRKRQKWEQSHWCCCCWFWLMVPVSGRQGCVFFCFSLFNCIPCILLTVQKWMQFSQSASSRAAMSRLPASPKYVCLLNSNKTRAACSVLHKHSYTQVLVSGDLLMCRIYFGNLD